MFFILKIKCKYKYINIYLHFFRWAIGNVRITENSIKYINMILKES